MTVARGDPTADGTPPIVGNDTVFVPNNVIGAADKMVLESIAVPASSANAIAVVLNADQSLAIDAKPGGSGAAYFDYVVRYAGTEAATGRVFVSFARTAPRATVPVRSRGHIHGARSDRSCRR